MKSKPTDNSVDEDYKYRMGITPMELTKDDKKRGKVIAKFHKQAATNRALLEDKMFYMIVNERPKDMSEKEWFGMLQTVLRIEVVQKYPKLIPTRDQS